jgi:hypothetical protein
MPTSRQHPAPTNKDWSIQCSACGTCCNSAPLLSLPELFHHQQRFVGTLGVRRIHRIAVGDRLGKGKVGYVASATDCAEFEHLARDCLHSIQGTDYHVLLTLQGFDDPDLGRCPALGMDGRCSVYADGKPTECAAVPLDPMVPDRLQHLVLAERCKDAEKRGTRCIRAKPNADARGSVQGPVVADDEARRALAARRGEVAADKRLWGTAVFAMLAKERLFDPAGAVRIPRQGALVMPLTPVLMVLAAVSEPCRERCLDFLDAQIALCESTLRASNAHKPASAAATLERLRAIMRKNQALRSVLLSGQRLPAASEVGSRSLAEVETRLGVQQRD